VFDPAFLANLFGAAVDRIVGPAYQGFADAATFRPVDGRGIRMLTEADVPTLGRLRAACDATEWAHSTIELDRPESVFVCFAGGAIAAAGTLKPRRDSIASVGIITHPAYHGLGYGRAVVSAMTAHALDDGLIPPTKRCWPTYRRRRLPARWATSNMGARWRCDCARWSRAC